jgi:hypothetical protein
MSKKAISGELEMFGMSEDAIREQYINSVTAKLSGQEMVVAGILSDAQEMMAYPCAEDAVMDAAAKESVRKQLNIAKFILFEMMDAKRDEETVLVSSDDREIA